MKSLVDKDGLSISSTPLLNTKMPKLQPRWSRSFLNFTACKDPDWLLDLFDHYTNKYLHELLWKCYADPCVIDICATPEQAVQIEQRLARCGRIIEKGLQILYQIRDIDKDQGFDRYTFWKRLTDKELEILDAYPAFRAWGIMLWIGNGRPV